MGDVLPLPQGLPIPQKASNDGIPTGAINDGIPTGAWRDGLFDCCILGPCHAMCCLTYWLSPGRFAAA